MHAFQSTTAQFVDPNIFNTDSLWSRTETGKVPETWKKQFGEESATTYLREIAGVSSSRDEFNDLVQSVSTIVGGGGIESVTLGSGSCACSYGGACGIKGFAG